MLFLCTFVAIFSIVSCEDKSCFSCKEMTCLLTPETVEGPYYLDYNLIRKDVREGKPGLRVDLEFIIIDANNCKPLPNVMVDIWHCDPFGYYSGYLKYGPNEAPLHANHLQHSDNSTFMRGVQYTNSAGFVQFVTNFPGWYFGRTTHIHVKVFKAEHKYVYTGQLYFTEYLTAIVSKLDPYIKHKYPRVHNEDDRRFTQDFGNQSLFMTQQINKYNIKSGLKAKITLSINANKN